MLLYADELEAGQVNRQNEVWIKAGKTFAVPIDIGGEGTVLHWEFTSQPKVATLLHHLKVAIFLYHTQRSPLSYIKTKGSIFFPLSFCI